MCCCSCLPDQGAGASPILAAYALNYTWSIKAMNRLWLCFMGDLTLGHLCMVSARHCLALSSNISPSMICSPAIEGQAVATYHCIAHETHPGFVQSGSRPSSQGR